MTDARSRRSLLRHPSRAATTEGAPAVSDSITIALDAMGGDHAPGMVLKGADIALVRHPDTRFLLFGNEAQIMPLLSKLPQLGKAATLHHTGEVVLGDARPSQA